MTPSKIINKTYVCMYVQYLQQGPSLSTTNDHTMSDGMGVYCVSQESMSVSVLRVVVERGRLVPGGEHRCMRSVVEG